MTIQFDDLEKKHFMARELDKVDLRILELLQQNARLTNKEIGEMLNKTSTPIYERIKRMEEQGYIKGYVALLDHKKLDRGVMAFVQITIRDHSNESLHKFIDDMANFDEVLECYQISGEHDFILKVAVKDLDTYQDFLMNKLYMVIPLGSAQTTFVLKEAKHRPSIDFDIKK